MAAKPARGRRAASPTRARRGLPDTLGIAMVGHAFMGRAHANAFRQVGRFFDLPIAVEPRVVVGRDARRAAAAARRLGFADSSTDLDAVLARDDVHVVDVATPNDSHHAIATAALEAGKMVLCEKPLAMTVEEARRMAALARRKKLPVGLWHNYRRCPAAMLARRILERGDLGEVLQVRAAYLQDWLSDPQAPASWRTDAKRCGSGAHGDLNAHLIDMTRHLTGLEFEEVSALSRTFHKQRPAADRKGRKARVTVDDAFAFLARFKGKRGAIGTYEATRVAPGRKNHNRIEVNGTRGSLVWSLERMNELELFRFDDPRDTRGFRTIMCMDDVHPYAGNWWPDGHILGYEHTFVNHLADWLRALAAGERFHPDFDDGLAVQAVLEAAHKSANSGRWEAVEA